jgi:hypothetical protein
MRKLCIFLFILIAIVELGAEGNIPLDTVNHEKLLYQNVLVTKSLLIEKLTNNESKAWFKCASRNNPDRQPGDKRYVFRKKKNQFSIETCDNQLKWITDKNHKWSIVMEEDGSPTGFHHFLLKIDDHYATGFRFDSRFKTLYFKLPEWKEGMCLR